MKAPSTNISPLLIIGPSGAGKGTLLTRLLKDFPDVFEMSISLTTRPPKKGEIEGKDKYFILEDEFERDLQNGEYLITDKYCGYNYATKKSIIEGIAAKGKVCIFESTIQSAETLYGLNFVVNFLFISPPSLDVLYQRLRGRSTESDEQIHQRVEIAQKELARAAELEYIQVKIVNDDFDEFYNKVLKQLSVWYPQFNWSRP